MMMSQTVRLPAMFTHSPMSSNTRPLFQRVLVHHPNWLNTPAIKTITSVFRQQPADLRYSVNVTEILRSSTNVPLLLASPI